MKNVGPWKLGAAALVIVGLLWLGLVGRTSSQSVVKMPPGAPNLLTNTDFQKTTNGLPDSWYLDRSLAGKGSVKIISGGSKPGDLSLCLIPTSQNNDSRAPFALAQMIFPEPF